MKIFCKGKLEKVSELKKKFNPKNPNKHPDNQIDKIIEIFQKNGIRKPIIISNLSGLITCGHGRILAAEKIGLKDFPVEYQDYESDAQEYQDMVADNSIQSWAFLDFSQINVDIQDLGPELDIGALALNNFFVEPMDKFVDNPQDEWKDMPEFDQDKDVVYKSLIVHFGSKIYLDEFIKLVGQEITENTKYIWYPKQIKLKTKDKIYE